MATLGPGNKVAIKPIVVAQDLGTSIEVASGIAAKDRIILNPPDNLREGEEVRPAAPLAGAPPQTAARESNVK